MSITKFIKSLTPVYRRQGNHKTTAIIIAVVLVLTLSYFLFLPVNITDREAIDIKIDEGDGLSVVASLLKENELIRNQAFFKLYVAALGDQGNLKAGRYSLSRSQSLVRIAFIITGGDSDLDEIKIVIPEGSNVWEIDELLADAGIIEETKFSSKFYKDEGYLFPDTYRFKKVEVDNSQVSLHGKVRFAIKEDEEVGAIGEKLKQNFIEKTSELVEGLTLDEIDRVITIASILEKEVFTYKEMRLVAGIIEKRISLDMPMQIDATVAYGACMRDFENSSQAENCKVHWIGVGEEIKLDSEYNSYTRKELPPGPISNPGLLAIQAALNPLESDYLYYLSPRDSIETLFSKTDVEHAAKRKVYLGL